MEKNLKYICVECGNSSIKWVGLCPICLQWNTYENKKTISINSKSNNKTVKLKEITSDKLEREIITLSEFNRVTGGIVKGSLNLIGGEPGVGKSTLLLQIADQLHRKGKKVIYITGEENLGQIATRSKRLDIDPEIKFLNEIYWERIKNNLETEKAEIIIIDSIQTTKMEENNGSSGSISQLKELTFEIMNYVKEKNITTFLVGHITKDGNLSGPKVLEHMVDAVFYMENSKNKKIKILRANKNRFNSINEIGIFAMTEKGFFDTNLNDFLKKEEVEGSAASCFIENGRLNYLEVQSLINENKSGNGKRIASGIDANRLSIILALIEKNFKLSMNYYDVYTNVYSNLGKIKKANDLSLYVSLISSYKNKKISGKDLFLGEISLSGEIKEIDCIEDVVKEVHKLGYKRIFCSNKLKSEKIEMMNVNSLREINNFF